MREPFPEVKILRYPAIAEEDENNRRKGEALFPEHKSLSFLLRRAPENIDPGELAERVPAESDHRRWRDLPD